MWCALILNLSFDILKTIPPSIQCEWHSINPSECLNLLFKCWKIKDSKKRSQTSISIKRNGKFIPKSPDNSTTSQVKKNPAQPMEPFHIETFHQKSHHLVRRLSTGKNEHYIVSAIEWWKGKMNKNVNRFLFHWTNYLKSAFSNFLYLIKHHNLCAQLSKSSFRSKLTNIGVLLMIWHW